MKNRVKEFLGMNGDGKGPTMKLKPEDLRRLREQARIVGEEEKRVEMLRSSLLRLREQLAAKYGMPPGCTVEMESGRILPPAEVGHG